MSAIGNEDLTRRAPLLLEVGVCRADQFGGDTLANKMYTEFRTSPLTSGGGGAIGEHRSSALAMVIFLLVIPFVAYQVRQMVKARATR